MPVDYENIRYNKWNRQRPQASDGDIDRFINNCLDTARLKREPGKYIRPAQWMKKTWKLQAGKTVFKGDKMINPCKMDISNINTSNTEVWKKIMIDGYSVRVSNKGKFKTLDDRDITIIDERSRNCCRVQIGKKRYSVQRLVAIAYLNEQEKKYVFHKDGDYKNNKASNLFYSNSMKDSYRSKMIMSTAWGNPKGRDNKKAVINLNEKRIFASIENAAKHYNITPSSISRCLAKLQKTAGGFNWQYA